MTRTAELVRTTLETDIELRLDLDGSGTFAGGTGVGFFDHMLTHVAKHGLFDLTVRCTGDLHIDAHHTVEDVGLAFGKALAEALGDKRGIRRYGDCLLPMDDALIQAAIDLSGRPFLAWGVDVPNETLGSFHSSLAEEFWRAASNAGTFNLHVRSLAGRNAHHLIEASFKAIARSLRQAAELDPRSQDVPSTKGVL